MALTAERLREIVHYNPETGEFRWRHDRRCGNNRIHRPAGSPAGTTNKNGYRQIHIDGKNYYGHRLAWLHVHNGWPVGEIDHINGNRADNRIENLREATRSQNSMNSGARSDNRFGMRGVSVITRRGKYEANIKIDGKRICIGKYDTPEAANAAYQARAAQLFGTFRRAP